MYSYQHVFPKLWVKWQAARCKEGVKGAGAKRTGLTQRESRNPKETSTAEARRRGETQKKKING